MTERKYDKECVCEVGDRDVHGYPLFPIQLYFLGLIHWLELEYSFLGMEGGNGIQLDSLGMFPGGMKLYSSLRSPGPVHF